MCNPTEIARYLPSISMEIQILKFVLLSPLNFSIFGILNIFKMLICSINVDCYEINPLYIVLVEPPNCHRIQGRSEGTSSLAFEVLIVKSEIDFINLFIFNCLTSNINLFIFNCLTSNISLFNFNCLSSIFCFPKNIFFRKQKRTDVHGRASLFSGVQLNLENYDLLSSRHK